jgi:hypothetical protein
VFALGAVPAVAGQLWRALSTYRRASARGRG